MESNKNYVIVVAMGWHRVAFIFSAHFVTSNYTLFHENC